MLNSYISDVVPSNSDSEMFVATTAFTLHEEKHFERCFKTTSMLLILNICFG